MKKLQGNLLGLKPSQKQRLEKLFQRRVPPDQFVTLDLARNLCELSLETGRQVGVLVDRRGRVEDVFVGDARQIEITGLGRYRAGRFRLRGLRYLHTHLKGEPLSHDDLTDLALLRFDLAAAIEVLSSGLPGKVSWAHIRPASPQDSSPWILEEPVNVQSLPQDFQSFIEGLESELAASLRSAQTVQSGRKKALLVGVTTGPLDLLQQHMEELLALAESADLDVVDVVTQRRQRLDPKFVVGSGKMKDLYIQCLQSGADLMIFDGELSASQNRAISMFGELEVWDRTQLILGIFAKRAHSRGGKLQVELAMLKYTLPRLVMRDDFLSRLTGGIGARGPGETKMEVLQRRIRDRITRLERELKDLGQDRKTRRARRTKAEIPTVSIVGYTNAGKSTLLNSLTNSDVLAESRMFATLDPTSRRLRLPSGRHIVLTDTVGFIRDLPADLSKAFRATLEELGDADVLLHLLDASNPQFQEQLESVDRVLGDLAYDNIPTLLVFNKVDALEEGARAHLAETYAHVQVSAWDPDSLRPVLERLDELLSSQAFLETAGPDQ